MTLRISSTTGHGLARISENLRVLLGMFFLVISFCSASCGSERDPATEPGPNGEPGADLKRIYSQEFRAPRSKYFVALNEFYAFANAHGFDAVEVGTCFGDVLAAQVRSLDAPCIVMWAALGTPVKAHMTFTVEEKAFYRIDRNDHVRYRIELYTFEGYAPVNGLKPMLEAQIEPKLEALDSSVGSERPSR